MRYTDAVDHLRKNDPVLADLIEKVGPCRLEPKPADGDLFHALAEAIIYQQLSGKAAATIHRRFLELYEGVPTPAAVLATDDARLRGAGISSQKSRYLRDLAEKMPEMPSFDELQGLEDEAIVKALTRVKGIGRWTVQMLLIFRLGRPDVLPVDDLGVRAGAKRVYGLPDLPERKALEALGERWRPWCSIASWYLWRAVEMPEGKQGR